jgi:DNA-binding transcriptional LysR family regulator
MNRGDLDDLMAFATIARERSFTRAAAELRLSTSALSYAIKQLEARLGVRLLNRNSRSVQPTDAGEQLLLTLAPALAEIGNALDDLNRAGNVVSGTVRITATRQSYESVIRPVLAGFCAQYPEATIEVVIDYGVRDIIADRFDAGIRLGEKVAQDMIAVPVGPPLSMAVVASPAYLAAHPLPSTPHDLLQHRCINYRLMTSGAIYAWEFQNEGRLLEMKVDGPLAFNEPELMLDAALDGLGVAYVMETLAEPYLESGQLIRLLDDWTLEFPGYYLYYSSRRQVPPTLSAFIAALRRMAVVPS